MVPEFDPAVFDSEKVTNEVPTPWEFLVRSVAGERLAHAYLFLGDEMPVLSEAAVSLACLLNCETRPKRASDKSRNGHSIRACGVCSTCRRIASHNHPDVTWVRPQNKLRQIDIDQVREVIHQLAMKPAEADHKVLIFVHAERLNVAAANAFLKTLEEPPQHSTILLLSTDPSRFLDTILSRCQRLTFGTGGKLKLAPHVTEWLREFAQQAAQPGAGLMPRYKLLGTLLTELTSRRETLDQTLRAASPLEAYPDASPDQKERWEDELKAQIESEYRLHRGEYLTALHAWLRDVWLQTLGQGGQLLNLPEYGRESSAVGSRIQPREATGNLESWEGTQRLLFTNVQEALALEVGLLKLNL